MQANIANRTVFVKDNLPVLRSMDTESIDLIYLDPPFNSKKQWEAPIGSTAEGASFKDTWTYDDIKAEWWRAIEEKSPVLYSVISTAGMVGGKADKAYMCYMAIRLLEMRRILKKTGSIYLHCDPTMSHFLKLTLDAIFGGENFGNEVIWHYRTYQGKVSAYYPKKHDVILVYTKSDKAKIIKNLEYKKDYEATVDYKRWRKYFVNGNEIKYGAHPRKDSRFTAYINRWKKENGRTPKKNEVIYKCQGYVVDDVFTDIQAIDPKDKVNKIGYPTQKPIALLMRIIAASSNKGDLVLDPFCGCGTACDAAEKLSRKWIGIDVSELAGKIIKNRLPMYAKTITIRDDLPERTSADPSQFKLGLPRTEPEKKQHLYGKQGGVCAGCNVLFPIRNMTTDHIIPRKKGGASALENYQLLCGACNSTKGGNLTTDELRAKLREKGII